GRGAACRREGRRGVARQPRGWRGPRGLLSVADVEMAMPRSEGWRAEACLECGQAMPDYCLLVVESVRRGDGRPATICPAWGRFCSGACLRAWAVRQDAPEGEGGSDPSR